MIFLLAVVLLLLFCLLLYAVLPFGKLSAKDTALINLIPGPKTLPILGNALDFNVSIIEFMNVFKGYFQKYGPVIRVWALTTPIVVIMDPDDVQILLQSRIHINKSYFYHVLQNLLGNGIVKSGGESWKRRHKLLVPAFHTKSVNEYAEIYKKIIPIFVSKLRAVSSQPWVNIFDLICLSFMDAICEDISGVECHAQRDNRMDVLEAAKDIQKVWGLRSSNLIYQGDLLFKLSPLGRREANDIKILHDSFREIIRKAKTEYRRKKEMSTTGNLQDVPAKRLNMVELMLEAQDAGEPISDQDILDEVGVFLLAGSDTSSIAATFATFMLATHPDVQEKALDEMNEIFGSSDRTPSLSDLNQMKYLEQIIKETLRLYPSGPVLIRDTVEPLKLKNYTVPKDITVMIPLLCIQKNPEVYDNPESFDPDRFLPERAAKRHPFAFIPFSAGPRNCIGQRLGMLTVKAHLSAILRNFHVSSPDKFGDIKAKVSVTLMAEPIVRIKLTPREKTSLKMT